MVLVNSLMPSTGSNIFILTNPIQTGKTTSLIEWSEKRNDVFGILTPVVNGERKFLDVHTHQVFDMEAMEGETETLAIGRYKFSKNNFEKAIRVIGHSINKEGWLIIDEIGPLELKGEGFYEVAKKVIATKNGKQKIILVAREGLVDKVKELFDINNSIVIHKISDLE